MEVSRKKTPARIPQRTHAGIPERTHGKTLGCTQEDFPEEC